MDNLTHSLLGAVLGQMGLKRKTGLAMSTLIIAANIPDIDAVAVLLGGHQHLAIRRGVTHGPIAMVILPLLLWAAMLWFDAWQTRRGKRPENRLPLHKGWLLALAYIGCLSHPLFDWFNSYGIRLLEPFSSQWFYGDSLFIIDIWIWVALGLGVWLSLRCERRGAGNWTRPAWCGFAAVCAYIFANGLITGHAERLAVREVIALRNPTVSLPDPLVVANPVPLAFWQREILWRDENEYGRGYFNMVEGKAKLAALDPPPPILCSPSPACRRQSLDIRPIGAIPEIYDVSSQDLNGRAYLFWSRMPYVINKQGSELAIGDQRFSNPLIGDRFRVTVTPKQ
jgi:inner membrane protein